MDPAQLQAYLALFASAMAIGDGIYNGVKSLVSSELSPEENAAVLAQWDENAARSRRNAGLPPELP